MALFSNIFSPSHNTNALGTGAPRNGGGGVPTQMPASKPFGGGIFGAANQTFAPVNKPAPMPTQAPMTNNYFSQASNLFHPQTPVVTPPKLAPAAPPSPAAANSISSYTGQTPNQNTFQGEGNLQTQ